MLTILCTYNNYADLLFLPEKRVINGINKLVCTFYDKENFICQIGLFLRKVDAVKKIKQKIVWAVYQFKYLFQNYSRKWFWKRLTNFYLIQYLLINSKWNK